jgi:hypothetical protein
MIFINWQTVRSARSILLNSDSAAWRFRAMLRFAVVSEADICGALGDVRFQGQSGKCLNCIRQTIASSAY